MQSGIRCSSLSAAINLCAGFDDAVLSFVDSTFAAQDVVNMMQPVHTDVSISYFCILYIDLQLSPNHVCDCTDCKRWNVLCLSSGDKAKTRESIVPSFTLFPFFALFFERLLPSRSLSISISFVR